MVSGASCRENPVRGAVKPRDMRAGCPVACRIVRLFVGRHCRFDERCVQLQAQLANLIGTFLRLSLGGCVAARCQRSHRDFHEGDFAVCCRLERAQVAGLNTVLGQLCAHAGNQHIVVGVLHIRAILSSPKSISSRISSGVVLAYSASSRRV